MITFTLIQTPEDLLKESTAWVNEKELAIDIECENNLHHYGSFISIIQISSRTRNWIVDVLAIKDLAPLLNTFNHQSILKIFHGVGFDFRILKHQYNCVPKPFFDTQLAANFLGKEKVGLRSLLKEYLNIIKDEHFQMVDWTRRPLSSAMLAYAAKDTAYLLPLKDILCQKLQETNRTNWVEQELNSLQETDFTYHEQTHLDLPGVRTMTPQQRTMLHVLFEERKRIAQEVDRPVFMVFTNKQIVQWIQNPPRDWTTVPQVHPRVKHNAEHITALVKNALNGKGEMLPFQKRQRLTPQQLIKIKELTDNRNLLAKKLSLPCHLLLNKDQIRDIAVTGNWNSARPWQREVFRA